jgi:hypothetical protein
MADSSASISLVNIYRVPLHESELPEQLRKYYFFGNAARDASHVVYTFMAGCVPLVLFDIILDNLDERFRMGHFTEEMPGVPRKAWQCAYDEELLSADGTQVIARNSSCTRDLQSGRIAFYFRYYNPLSPRLWSYGQFWPARTACT